MALRTAIAIVTVLAFASVPRPAIAAGAAQPCDFDGNGFADLAMTAIGEEVGAKDGAGAVNVIYGSSAGLTAAGDQVWSQDSPGVKGIADASNGDDFEPIPGDTFGFALACGDFDADGFADLAVGAPGDRVDGIVAGGVDVLYGSRDGLTATGDQLWSEASLPGEPRTNDRFGRSLASGDFNGDGYADVAIGIADLAEGVLPDEAGGIEILFGSAAGLTSAGTTRLAYGTDGLPGTAHDWSRFGIALASGDVNGDGHADLAARALDGSTPGSGAVILIPGAADGMDVTLATLWVEGVDGVPGTPGADSGFGSALAFGDFNGDGTDDLAIGAPFATVDAAFDGAIAVLYGGDSGLSTDGAQWWHQGARDVPGAPEEFDYFGSAVASADLNGDRRDDLAIGVAGEAVGSVSDAGAVLVLGGSSTGLSTEGARTWTQDSAGVPGKVEPYDGFGYSIAAGQYGGSGRADLAIGAVSESLAGVRSAGCVTMLFGRYSGLSSIGAELWSQASDGIKGSPESDDHLGYELAR